MAVNHIVSICKYGAAKSVSAEEKLTLLHTHMPTTLRNIPKVACERYEGNNPAHLILVDSDGTARHGVAGCERVCVYVHLCSIKLRVCVCLKQRRFYSYIKMKLTGTTMYQPP